MKIMAYPKKPGNIKGFTLIEVIMVIVIIGILVSVAIPRFNSFYAVKFSGAIKKVVSDIRYVQSLAISRHETCRIVFDSLNNTYSVYLANNSLAIDPFTRGSLQINFNTSPQYNGIDITSVNFGGTNTLRFTWEGVPQDGNGTNLSADGSVGFSYQGNISTIYITPNTGKVRVQ